MLALAFPVMLFAGINDDKPIKQDKVVYLYPGGQATSNGIYEGGVYVTQGAGADNGKHGPEEEKDGGKVSGIGDTARMEIYLAPDPNGLMVINCAGGSYSSLSTLNEGYCAVEWMLSQGVSVCNLFYRMPYGNKIIPLTDVQNAMRYCRYHAHEWGIEKVGVMGFSAGGHLAASASTMFTDKVTRPDFSILFYPVISMEDDIAHEPSRNNLLGEYPSRKEIAAYSLQHRVTPETPITFIGVSGNDSRVPVQHSLDYYAALRANNVISQMHVYPLGSHGWGFGAPPYTERDKLGRYRPVFRTDLLRFLKDVASMKNDN